MTVGILLGRIIPEEDSDSEDPNMDNDEYPLQDEVDYEFKKRVKNLKV
jgi:hypothetical protein